MGPERSINCLPRHHQRHETILTAEIQSDPVAFNMSTEQNVELGHFKEFYIDFKPDVVKKYTEQLLTIAVKIILQPTLEFIH